MRPCWTTPLRLGLLALWLAACASTQPPAPPSEIPVPLPAAEAAPVAPSPPAARSDLHCEAPTGFVQAGAREAAGLYTLAFAPFGRDETGWAAYAPAVAQEIASPCPPGTAAFAASLAAWQAGHGLAASGVMDVATFGVLHDLWQARRPFLAVRAEDICPDPPAPDALVLGAADITAGKPVQLRARAMDAYLRLRAAARAAVPELAADPKLLRIFSAFRAPAYDDERCARQGDCNGVARAQCSSHRTGLALDLMLGAAAGHAVDSSDDANRLYQARGPAYLWLVANAARFGFVNYVFEPWHWEWTGEPVVVPPAFQN